MTGGAPTLTLEAPSQAPRRVEVGANVEDTGWMAVSVSREKG